MIRGLILAIQFLTRIPINIQVDWNKDNLRKSMFFFPFVGMFIGFLSFLVFKVFLNINKNVASVFTVLSLIILTGGLHLDGLSDMADGFFSNKSKDRILTIMEDSRVGAFGVISLIILILLKFVLIGSISNKALDILVFSVGNSRFCQCKTVVFKKSAKPDGMGNLFAKHKPKPYAISGFFLYILLIVLVDVKYLIPLFISLVFSELISFYSYRKIGGVTGDIFGATAEICEVVSLISFLGVFIWI